ncbi:hypothetical protein GIB67_003016 [Kingdonia uniflora]|uniref:Fe2OG dioxygenase domain-containing protein n=1 Tax=Kingdonia uniflora TaxID=39325 RepID=A0A7J7LYJ4_9MAGN|nr:hypothetical protein GIB67_003016 [Kingdonia uniflora]
MEVVRVQTIATTLSNKIDTIPFEFIRPVIEQPAHTTFAGPVPEIPTLDLSDPDTDNLVRTIAKTSSEWGLFQVVNHGVPVDVIKRLQSVGKEFFELSQEEKELYARPPNAMSLEGYGTKLQKEVAGKKAWVDYLFHNVWPPSRNNYKFWPKNPSSYREANEEYAQCLREVVDKLLVLLSLGLGLERNVMREAFGGDDLEYLLKINYYPPCPRPDLALGVVPHTDMSALTILVPNDVPGLQVFKDDHWFDVNYIPNALIVHIGDQVEILSNGKYKSVYHRAIVNKNRVRISWPVFCSPPSDMVVGPLPQLVNEENPAKYKTKKYKDYEYCKLNKLPQ